MMAVAKDNLENSDIRARSIWKTEAKPQSPQKNKFFLYLKISCFSSLLGLCVGILDHWAAWNKI